MAFIQQNLRQHLFTNGADALIGAFPDNTAQLFNGINYRYNDKVWNIRIAWDKNAYDDIQGVFIRVHSRDGLYGYHFAQDNERDSYISYRTISYSHDGNSKDSRGPLKNSQNIPFEFITHLNSGRLAQDVEPPKLPLALRELAVFTGIGKFFERGDHLIPEFDVPFVPPNPLDQPQPDPLQEPHLEDRNNLTRVLSFVLFIAGVYMTVKIVQYVRNQSGPRDLNRSGTGAVA